MLKSFKNLAIIFVSCVAMLVAVSPFIIQKVPVSVRATEGGDSITLLGEQPSCLIDGVAVALQGKSYTRDGHSYLSVDDVFRAIGYSVEWNQNIGAISCVKNGIVTYIFPNLNNMWVGPTEYVFDHKPIIVGGRVYISDAMFKTATGRSVLVEGELSEYRKIMLYGGQNIFTVDEASYTLTQRAFVNNKQIYVPVEDILPALGYSVKWDAPSSAIVCTRDGVVSYLYPYRNNIWVGPEEYVFDSKPMVLHNKTYVSDKVIKKLSGSNIGVSGELELLKNGKDIMQSQKTDVYRLPGTNVVSGGGVTVVDGFGMEFPWISDDNARDYANIINSVAETLDANINIYNMVVPTAAEYYAPQNRYPNQLHGIQAVYSNLDDRVIPVNVYDTLAKHAGEKLYFSTDHHWTQRGAYYAYKEFMDYKCVAVPEINTFNNAPAYDFVGSFAAFARGTDAGNIMKNSPELLERYIPKYATTGNVYSDPALKNKLKSVDAVYPQWTSYSSFIGGDNPITIFDTNAPGNKTLVIVKESYGNAFATWALNDYKRVCIVDPRQFNGFDGKNTKLKLSDFCRTVGATDVLFINYPLVVASQPIKAAIAEMK